MDFRRRLQNHHKRWDIVFDEDEQFERLKNRMLVIIEGRVGKFFVDDFARDNEFAVVLGAEIEVKERYTPKPDEYLARHAGIRSRREFGSTRVWWAVEHASDLEQLVTALQVLLWILEKYEHPGLVGLARDAREAAKLTPGASLGVAIRGTSVTLYPSGVEPLDKVAVEEVLS